MSPSGVAVPPRLPVPADRLVGHLVRVPAERCRYRDTALTMLVRRVRLDISQWYGGAWVWLEGDELTETGHTRGKIQALVHVSACITGASSAPDAGEQSPYAPPAVG